MLRNIQIFAAFIVAIAVSSSALAAGNGLSDKTIVQKADGEFCYHFNTTNEFALMNRAERCTDKVLDKAIQEGLVSLPGRPFSLPLKEPYEIKPGAVYPTVDLYLHEGKEAFGLFFDAGCNRYAGCGNFLPRELVFKTRGTIVDSAIDTTNSMWFEHLVDTEQNNRHLFVVLSGNQSFNIQLFPDNPSPKIVAAAWDAVKSMVPKLVTGSTMKSEIDSLNLNRWNTPAVIPDDWREFAQDALPFVIRLPDIQSVEGGRLSNAKRQELKDYLFNADEMKNVAFDSEYVFATIPVNSKELSFDEVHYGGTGIRVITFYVNSDDPESVLSTFCKPAEYDKMLENGFYVFKQECNATVNPSRLLSQYTVVRGQTISLIEVLTSGPTPLFDAVLQDIQTNDHYQEFNGWHRFLFAVGNIIDALGKVWDALIVGVHNMLFKN